MNPTRSISCHAIYILRGKYRIRFVRRVNKCGAIDPRDAINVFEVEDCEERQPPSYGVGVLIVSTPEDVLPHVDAKNSKVGDRALAYVY